MIPIWLIPTDATMQFLLGYVVGGLVVAALCWPSSPRQEDPPPPRGRHRS